jgi:hypothetical protein
MKSAPGMAVPSGGKPECDLPHYEFLPRGTITEPSTKPIRSCSASFENAYLDLSLPIELCQENLRLKGCRCLHRGRELTNLSARNMLKRKIEQIKSGADNSESEQDHLQSSTETLFMYFRLPA